MRGGAGIRALVAATRLRPGDLVAPIFVRSGDKQKTPVPSMPGVFQFSVDTAVEELRRLQGLGIGGFILFGVTDGAKKDATGSWALRGENEVCRTLKAARDAGITMVAMTDVCFCEYTSHGHCGMLKKATPGSAANVDNDETIRRLAEQAVLHAKAGADVVAPSAMMDNQVGAIRSALDSAACDATLILSYSVKYASAFYGPFRDAAQSPPAFGDRSGYQMDVRGGVAEALREAQLDVQQGADIVMVKPALPYLDVLRGNRSGERAHGRVPCFGGIRDAQGRRGQRVDRRKTRGD